MKIFNAMFSTAHGGVEQVFLNYTAALEMQGHQVLSVIHPWAKIKKECPKERLKTLFSFGRNDSIAVRRLRHLIEKEAPDCIITHTKRASFLFKKTQTKVPIIGVCHAPQSYLNLANNSDAVIAITHNMHQEIKASGTDIKKIYVVPNMLEIPKGIKYREPQVKAVPIIGVSARFSDLKGIDFFIDALAELKRRKIAFKAQIAGDGKQKKQYIKQIHLHSLHNEVRLLGWVNDTDAFYKGLDIFCHPSLKESFGLVVVEAMLYSLPMVLTRASGPLEIIGDSECAVMVPTADAISLADGLEKIIKETTLAKQLTFKAFHRAHTYSIAAVAPILHDVIVDCLKTG